MRELWARRIALLTGLLLLLLSAVFAVVQNPRGPHAPDAASTTGLDPAASAGRAAS
jgi:hypothetical protein